MNDSKHLGHPDYLDSHSPNSPTFDYEFGSDSKFLDFTLRDISQLQDQDTMVYQHTYDSQTGINSSTRFNQAFKSSQNSENNTYRKDKPPKSNDNTLYLPYNASIKHSDSTSSQPSQKMGLLSGDKRNLKVVTKEDKGRWDRPRSVLDTKRKDYGQETHGVSEERIRSYSSNRNQTEALGNVKGEMEEIRNKLRNKEREVTDNLQLIENLQKMLNKGNEKRFDMEMIQELQKKKRELEEENQELRETVRNEILVSERHRSQLEFAQNALEGRLESLGILTSNSKSTSGLRSVDLLIEYQNLQLLLQQKEEETKNIRQQQTFFASKIQFLEAENQKLNRTLTEKLNETLKVQEDRDNSLKALQSSRENQRKIEEERAELIDYYNNELVNQEELNQKLQEAENRLSQLQEENEKLKILIEESDEQYENIKTELEEKLESLAELHDQKVEALDINRTLQDKKDILLAETDHLKVENKKLSQEITIANNKTTQIEEEYKKLKKEQNESELVLKEELEKLNNEIKTLEVEKIRYRNEKEAAEVVNERKLAEQREVYEAQTLDERKQYEQRIDSLKDMYEHKLKELEINIKKTQNLNKIYEERLQETSTLCESKQSELSQTKEALKSKSTHLDAQEETLAKLSQDNTFFKDRLNKIESENQNQIDEIRKTYQKDNHQYEVLIESKNKEINELTLTNFRIKAEVDTLQETLEITEKNLETKMRELEVTNKDYENYKLMTENLEVELKDLKAANGFLTRYYNKQGQDLDEYENKMMNTLTSLKFAERTLYNIEQDNDMLKTENDELKEDLVAYKEENMKIKTELADFETWKDRYEKKLEESKKELEDLQNKNRNINNEKASMEEEIKLLKENDEYAKNLIEELMTVLRTFTEDMNRSSATAQNFLANCTTQLKEMLTTTYTKIQTNTMNKGFKESCEYLQTWYVMLLKEIEKDVLRILKMKEEVAQLKRENDMLRETINNNENNINDKYAIDRANDLRSQLKIIRAEKLELQNRVMFLQDREEILEKEKMNLKHENDELGSLINSLKESNAQLRASIEQTSKESSSSKSVLDNEIASTRTLKVQYESLFKEKKQLENLFTIVLQSIPSQEHAGLIKDILSLHLEVSQLEKESVKTETTLMEKESDLKLCLRFSNKTGQEIIQKRKEVEKLRQDFQNMNTQLGIFVKRKILLMEELKNIEKTEKRRLDQAMDIERELLKNREENNDLKLRYQNLVEINTTLQNKFKELSENNIGPQNSLISMNRLSTLSPSCPTQEDLPPSGLRADALRFQEKIHSRRLSVGNSDIGSMKSGISNKHHLFRGPLNDRTLHEEKQNNEIMGQVQQLLSIKKTASLKDKLSETKHILKNMRSNKENI